MSEKPIDSNAEKSASTRRRKTRRRRVSFDFDTKKKESSPLNKWVLILVLVGFLFNLGYLAFCFIRLNLPSTKVEVIAGVEHSTGADIGEVDNFNVGANIVDIQKVPFAYESAGVLEGHLRGVRADLGLIGYLKGELSGNTVRAQSGSAKITWPLSELDMAQVALEELPLSYKAYLWEDVDVSLVSGEKIVGKLSGARLTFRNNQVRFNEGKLSLFPFKSVMLDQAGWQRQGDRLELHSLTGSSSVTQGQFILDSETQKMRFVEFGLKDFLSERQLGLDLKINTKPDEEGLAIQYTEEGISFRGEVDVETMVLDYLAFVKDFALYFKNESYKSLHLVSLSKAQVDISEGKLTFANLDLVDSQFISVKGWVSVTPGNRNALSGELIVGVPAENVCNEYGEPVVRGFSEPEAGFSTIKVTLSGSIKAPKDDVATTVRDSWK